MQLREYQDQAVQAALQSLRRGESPIVRMATGTGKARTMGATIHGYLPDVNHPALILVHKRELVHQLAGTMRGFGFRVAVEQAEHTDLLESRDFDVAVASVQTLSARPESLDGYRFSLGATDEAHRSLADTYLAVYERLQSQGPVPLYGTTATAYRTDGRPLTDVYTGLVYEYGLREAMDDGWLKRLRARRAGFFVGEDEAPEALRPDAVVQAYFDEFVGRPTLIMAASVAEGQTIAEKLRDRGVAARAVDHTLSDTDRDLYLDEFRDGRCDVLVSFNILIEGFDAPRASGLIMARPTGARIVYEQAIGRILRPWMPDDLFAEYNTVDAAARREILSRFDDALLVDCVAVTATHNLAQRQETISTALGLHADFDYAGQDVLDVHAEIDELLANLPVVSTAALARPEDIERVYEDAEVFRQATVANVDTPDWVALVYTKHGDTWRCDYPGTREDGTSHVVKVTQTPLGDYVVTHEQPYVWQEWYWNGSRGRMLQKLYRGDGPPDMTATLPSRGKLKPKYTLLQGKDPEEIGRFADKDDAFDAAEGYVYDTYPSSYNMMRHDAEWRDRAVSEGQEKVLRKMRKAGIAVPDDIRMGRASLLITLYFQGVLKPKAPTKRKKGK